MAARPRVEKFGRSIPAVSEKGLLGLLIDIKVGCRDTRGVDEYGPFSRLCVGQVVGVVFVDKGPEAGNGAIPTCSWFSAPPHQDRV